MLSSPSGSPSGCCPPGHTGHLGPLELLQPPYPHPMNHQGPQLLTFVCWPVGRFFTSEAESYTKQRWTLNSP